MGATAIFELLAAIAALIAAVFIFDQHLHRPRPYKLMWSLGLLFYGIAAAAAFAGASSGWTVGEYKTWYFFGGTVTAIFLGLGSFYLLGPRRLALLAHTVANQFSSRVAPASPDFSGWNCVALTGPRSTAATNRSPCSAVVTRPSVWCTA